jgi:zinc protease
MARRAGCWPKCLAPLWCALLWCALPSTLTTAPLGAQEVGREAAERLRYPDLRFDPPEPGVHELAGGVTVYLLEDHALPLVDVMARLQGGYGHFERAYYAAGTALPGLMRSGGTTTLPPDSVDRLLEYYAVQTSFGGGGGSTFASLNTLTTHLDPALEVWGEMLKRPGFDSARLEVWRGQELESVARRLDDPGRLAFSEFNRLMFGDHFVGWELDAGDLEPERLSPERMRWVHARVFCRENLVLGVTGDITWEEARPRLERLVSDWPACEQPLSEPPLPDIRREPGIFLIPRALDQSTVVLAHATALRQEDSREYFASRIGNAILGASGLSSRLMARIRTEEGLAYSASSLWTTPVRYDGLVGATTRTRAESTVAAIQAVLDVLEQMRDAPPEADEVARAVEEATNGFVFNFDAPSQVISRRMFYQSAGLPEDWLSRFLTGIQRVRPAEVQRAFRRHLQLERMVILVVGDPEAFATPLESLGPVTVLDPRRPGPISQPSGRPRSPW